MYHTRLLVTCDPAFSEILIAELAEADFDSFLENDDGFEAYVEGERYNKEAVAAIREKYKDLTPITFSFSQIPKRNWNEEWEKSFSPVIVEDRCVIRAEFHQVDRKYPFEIVITPRMSFGTGHHQTTYLMVKTMLDMDFRGKRVMDAGCGTAILSILACKLGAGAVEAFDIDEWSVDNGNENVRINGCENIRIQLGKIVELALGEPYDVILANINRNVLLEEMQYYASYLKPGGQLLLSGFFATDIPTLLEEAARYGLREARRDERETWSSLLLEATSLT